LIFLARLPSNIFPNAEEDKITMKQLANNFKIDQNEIAFSLQNLNRLGCLIGEIDPTWKDIGATSFGRIISNDNATFNLSPLGFKLIETCSYNDV